MRSDKAALTALERGARKKHDIQVDATSGGHEHCVRGSIFARVQQSIVRGRSGALVLYIFLIALSCARLEIEPARVYLVMFCLILFGYCVDARIACREQDYKR